MLIFHHFKETQNTQASIHSKSIKAVIKIPQFHDNILRRLHCTELNHTLCVDSILYQTFKLIRLCVQMYQSYFQTTLSV